MNPTLKRILQNQNRTRDRLVLEDYSSHAVIAVLGNVAYKAMSTRLYRSTDGGLSYGVELANISPDYFSVGTVKDNGTVILFTGGGKIYRSTDGTTFNLVDTSALDPIRPPMYHGMDYSGTTIVFGEYTSSNGDVRIITSTDDGVSWSATLTKSAPAQLRHWHSANYFPIEGLFLVTSGDSDTQVSWFMSPDGVNWTQVSNVNHQNFRAVNMAYAGDGKIIWGTDTDLPYQSWIFRASLADPAGTKEFVFRLPNACWGIEYHDGLYVAITAPEEQTTSRKTCLYTSLDGINWRMNSKLPINNDSLFAGFRMMWYLSGSKRWIFNTYLMPVAKYRVWAGWHG